MGSSEAVLSAVHLVSFRGPPNVLSHIRSRGRLPAAPGRALIVSESRVLVLDDPTDSATTSAGRQYVAASSPLGEIVAIELRSHLLDCALTLVLASTGAAERVTIGYNGVNEPDVLVVVGLIRSKLDSQRRSPVEHSGSTVSDDRLDVAGRAGTELSYRQRYYLRKYLCPEEQLCNFLSIPALPRNLRWKRLSLLAHEQPPMLLARTDRQAFVVKNALHALRKGDSYGCDVWLMPLCTLATVELKRGRPESTIVFRLGRSAQCYSVQAALPSSLTDEAAGFVRAIQQRTADPANAQSRALPNGVDVAAGAR